MGRLFGGVIRAFTPFGGARVTTSPVASWNGADHEGEALPRWVDADVPSADGASAGGTPRR
jgi:hypothetical protein